MSTQFPLSLAAAESGSKAARSLALALLAECNQRPGSNIEGELSSFIAQCEAAHLECPSLSSLLKYREAAQWLGPEWPEGLSPSATLKARATGMSREALLAGGAEAAKAHLAARAAELRAQGEAQREAAKAAFTAERALLAAQAQAALESQLQARQAAISAEAARKAAKAEAEGLLGAGYQSPESTQAISAASSWPKLQGSALWAANMEAARARQTEQLIARRESEAIAASMRAEREANSEPANKLERGLPTIERLINALASTLSGSEAERLSEWLTLKALELSSRNIEA